jgi:hypothetical protein
VPRFLLCAEALTLENALEQIRVVAFEPKQTLPAVKRRIAKILLAGETTSGLSGHLLITMYLPWLRNKLM